MIRAEVLAPIALIGAGLLTALYYALLAPDIETSTVYNIADNDNETAYCRALAAEMNDIEDQLDDLYYERDVLNNFKENDIRHARIKRLEDRFDELDEEYGKYCIGD